MWSNFLFVRYVRDYNGRGGHQNSWTRVDMEAEISWKFVDKEVYPIFVDMQVRQILLDMKIRTEEIRSDRRVTS